MSPPSTNSPGVNPQSTPGFQSEYPTTAEELHRAQLEDKLEQLLQSLLEVGICTSDVQENAREGGRTGRGEPLGPGGLVGKKINESIEHMAELYELNANMASEIPSGRSHHVNFHSIKIIGDSWSRNPVNSLRRDMTDDNGIYA
ncbi:hypothetical protein PSHT_00085 [Puccinia striiformis]|uniref:Mediator of RNA polymerase II transcription subunit 10 n=1 Tax=Puccinia striiformis TaxID=27350 RepID=A0A2S4WP55_9BASI|nr:hypothetical protein PSHT_00085 [Puccinia striiformis]